MLKIIGICGESGAGKDTILNSLVNLEPRKFHKIVSCTTREKREDETSGVDYHFITPDKFFDQLLHDTMLEATDFNGEIYGTSKDSLSREKINVGVFDIEGLNILNENPDVQLLPIYLKADERKRLIRILQRDKKTSIDDIYDRYKLDKLIFSEVKDVEGIVTIDNNSSYISGVTEELKRISLDYFKNLTSR